MTQTITINLTKEKDEKVEMKKTDVQVNISHDKLYVTGIPDRNMLEYVARDTDTASTYFIVHSPKKEVDYGCFKLHIGPVNELVEANVQKVARARDGGTTDITYILAGQAGKLHFPTPFDKEAKPTNDYNGATITLDKLL